MRFIELGSKKEYRVVFGEFMHLGLKKFSCFVWQILFQHKLDNNMNRFLICRFQQIDDGNIADLIKGGPPHF